MGINVTGSVPRRGGLQGNMVGFESLTTCTAVYLGQLTTAHLADSIRKVCDPARMRVGMRPQLGVVENRVAIVCYLNQVKC